MRLAAVAIVLLAAVAACGSDGEESEGASADPAVDVDVAVERLSRSTDIGGSAGIRQLLSEGDRDVVLLAVAANGSSSCPPATLVGFDVVDGALVAVRDPSSIDADRVCTADVVVWTDEVAVSCSDVGGLALPDGTRLDLRACAS